MYFPKSITKPSQSKMWPVVVTLAIVNTVVFTYQALVITTPFSVVCGVWALATFVVAMKGVLTMTAN